ncbi:retinol dehydrogenase 8 isoform X2 [Trichosurus vulpecula]|uniref:retinol dehydrogenase 8 isoform X2 n=1 Tax=Trichosurus vulpecula TaxID=9337 RepID=UPI00186AC984|nr:retinol dehydrogenase 8 isoform X2 [Trichosurus vulpecula]
MARAEGPGHPRTVLITGCSSGIGLHLAVKLAQDPKQRYHVIATMRDLGKKEKLEAAAGEALGQTLTVAQMDVCSEDSISACLSNIEGGSLDVLVQLIKAVLPSMKQRHRGHIVVVSSVLGLQGLIFNDVYSASKFALEGFCESLAVQLLQFNIFVSLVEPGPVNTDFEAKLEAQISKASFPGTDPETLSYFFDVYLPGSKEVFQTLGQSPEDVAQAIAQVIGLAQPSLRYQTNALYTPLTALKYADPSGDLSVHTFYRVLFRCQSLFRFSLCCIRCLSGNCFRPRVTHM